MDFKTEKRNKIEKDFNRDDENTEGGRITKIQIANAIASFDPSIDVKSLSRIARVDLIILLNHISKVRSEE